MNRIGLVVEGHGDVDAFPFLIARIAAWIGDTILASRPVRSGGWSRLRKAGGLEGYVALVASDSIDKVVIVVDLDDGCPVSELESVSERVERLEILYGIKIEICFCIREFEAWFLCLIDVLSIGVPDYGWIEQIPIENHHAIRNAKGRLNECISEYYKESEDQEIFSRQVDVPLLFSRDRSFRRFVKAVTGLEYEILQAA